MERHKKDDILFIYRFIYNFLFYSFRSKNINAVSKNDLLKTNTASATAGSYYDYYNQYSAEEAAGHSVTVHADHITGAQHLEKSISTYENLSAGVLWFPHLSEINFIR